MRRTTKRRYIWFRWQRQQISGEGVFSACFLANRAAASYEFSLLSAVVVAATPDTLALAMLVAWWWTAESGWCVTVASNERMICRSDMNGRAITAQLSYRSSSLFFRLSNFSVYVSTNTFTQW